MNDRLLEDAAELVDNVATTVSDYIGANDLEGLRAYVKNMQAVMESMKEA